MNQGSMDGQAPVNPSPLGGAMGGIDNAMGGMMPPVQPTPVGGGENAEDPHDKIMAALNRIEGKLDAIAAKVGA